MDVVALISVIVIGLVEGITEFLPVSSTGHIILVEDLIGFAGPSGKVFEVVIQLGAILAVCIVYSERLTSTLRGLFGREPRAWRFAINLLVAVIPALILGAALHGIITTYLFSPLVVSIALIVGGFVMIWIERQAPDPVTWSVDDMTPKLALKIGFAQCVAMIPGVSRAGATIMGGLLLGLERKVATEFSFFLAIPTMIAASVFELYKNRESLTNTGRLDIALGFAVAFVAAAFVVRTLVGFIGRHGFVLFALYRILIGTMMLVLILTT